MGKNIQMLKTYRKVLKNDQDAINSIIPKMYAESFYTIDFNSLLSKGINNLIIDIDNTILPTDDKKVDNRLIEKINELKSSGFNICLVSNNFKSRVEPVAEVLKVSYLARAKKPLEICFINAMNLLNEKDKSKIAMIGDQMLTDVRGANDFNIYSILVKPLSNRHNIGTFTNRCLQNRIERYLKKKNIFDSDNYY